MVVLGIYFRSSGVDRSAIFLAFKDASLETEWQPTALRALN